MPSRRVDSLSSTHQDQKVFPQSRREPGGRHGHTRVNAWDVHTSTRQERNSGGLYGIEKHDFFPTDARGLDRSQRQAQDGVFQHSRPGPTLPLPSQPVTMDGNSGINGGTVPDQSFRGYGPSRYDEYGYSAARNSDGNLHGQQPSDSARRLLTFQSADSNHATAPSKSVSYSSRGHKSEHANRPVGNSLLPEEGLLDHIGSIVDSGAQSNRQAVIDWRGERRDKHRERPRKASSAVLRMRGMDLSDETIRSADTVDHGLASFQSQPRLSRFGRAAAQSIHEPTEQDGEETATSDLNVDTRKRNRPANSSTTDIGQNDGAFFRAPPQEQPASKDRIFSQPNAQDHVQHGVKSSLEGSAVASLVAPLVRRWRVSIGGKLAVNHPVDAGAVAAAATYGVRCADRIAQLEEDLAESRRQLVGPIAIQDQKRALVSRKLSKILSGSALRLYFYAWLDAIIGRYRFKRHHVAAAKALFSSIIKRKASMVLWSWRALTRKTGEDVQPILSELQDFKRSEASHGRLAAWLNLRIASSRQLHAWRQQAMDSNRQLTEGALEQGRLKHEAMSQRADRVFRSLDEWIEGWIHRQAIRRAFSNWVVALRFDQQDKFVQQLRQKDNLLDELQSHLNKCKDKATVIRTVLVESSCVSEEMRALAVSFSRWKEHRYATSSKSRQDLADHCLAIAESAALCLPRARALNIMMRYVAMWKRRAEQARVEKAGNEQGFLIAQARASKAQAESELEATIQQLAVAQAARDTAEDRCEQLAVDANQQQAEISSLKVQLQQHDQKAASELAMKSELEVKKLETRVDYLNHALNTVETECSQMEAERNFLAGVVLDVPVLQVRRKIFTVACWLHPNDNDATRRAALLSSLCGWAQYCQINRQAKLAMEGKPVEEHPSVSHSIMSTIRESAINLPRRSYTLHMTKLCLNSWAVMTRRNHMIRKLTQSRQCRGCLRSAFQAWSVAHIQSRSMHSRAGVLMSKIERIKCKSAVQFLFANFHREARAKQQKAVESTHTAATALAVKQEEALHDARRERDMRAANVAEQTVVLQDVLQQRDDFAQASEDLLRDVEFHRREISANDLAWEFASRRNYAPRLALLSVYFTEWKALRHTSHIRKSLLCRLRAASEQQLLHVAVTSWRARALLKTTASPTAKTKESSQDALEEMKEALAKKDAQIDALETALSRAKQDRSSALVERLETSAAHHELSVSEGHGSAENASTPMSERGAVHARSMNIALQNELETLAEELVNLRDVAASREQQAQDLSIKLQRATELISKQDTLLKAYGDVDEAFPRATSPASPSPDAGTVLLDNLQDAQSEIGLQKQLILDLMNDLENSRQTISNLRQKHESS